MADREKVINGLDCCLDVIRSRQFSSGCGFCPYIGAEHCNVKMIEDAIELLKEQEKEIKALRLLVEWATDCDFGFDQFPDEYERYKDEITDMKYMEGMIHVAKRTLEDHGAFEEER